MFFPLHYVYYLVFTRKVNDIYKLNVSSIHSTKNVFVITLVIGFTPSTRYFSRKLHLGF